MIVRNDHRGKFSVRKAPEKRALDPGHSMLRPPPSPRTTTNPN
jgi:hypothetical protein